MSIKLRSGTTHRDIPLQPQLLYRFLRHLRRPARDSSALLIIVFATMLSVSLRAGPYGLYGLPVTLLLVSWFFKYAFVLFDHVVHGFDEPPTLDIRMVNPFDEQRPLVQLAIIAGISAGVRGVAISISPIAGSVLAAAALLLLPASVAMLGLEGNPLKAVYAAALWRMIAGLGLWYVALLGLIAAVALLLYLLSDLDAWLVWRLGIAMFAVLAVFSVLGGALYERRHELGLETWHSPEQMHEKAQRDETRLRAAAVMDAYGLARAGMHDKAWEQLQNWLISRGKQVEDLRWLTERLRTWPDPRYVSRLTEDYVDRLMALKRHGEALDAVVERLAVDPKFRPSSSTATFRLAELAGRGGGAHAVGRMLLSDFAERFPTDPHVEAARRLASELVD